MATTQSNEEPKSGTEQVQYVPFSPGSACVECKKIIDTMTSYALHEKHHRNDELGVTYRCPFNECSIEEPGERGYRSVYQHIKSLHKSAIKHRVQYIINGKEISRSDLEKLRYNLPYRRAHREYINSEKAKRLARERENINAIPEEYRWILANPAICYKM